MEIKEALTYIVENSGEVFIKARDKGHAESMRVSAFNIRRRMPETLTGSIGIQTFQENNEFFLRVYDRGIDGAEVFTRDKETGKLIPIAKPERITEAKRIRELMKKDGMTDEEIDKVLKGE